MDPALVYVLISQSHKNTKDTHDMTTSLDTLAVYLDPDTSQISTPIVRGLTAVVSNSTRVTFAFVATFKFGLARTSGVRYAISAVIRRPSGVM